MFCFASLLCLLVAAVAEKGVDHCTAIAAGRKATADGSTFVGQSVDAEGGPGTSIRFIPAQDHAEGAMRPVVDQNTLKVIGHVPQVAHTFGYSDGSYGLMNEHQVAFGESTCSGRIAARSLSDNGTALFSNSELTHVALERCTTARCAIKLMGEFAVDHGFYGEGDTVNGGAETLVVADPTEAWVFHIMADPTGYSAIWAAQRVPDHQVAFVPNTFVIREMDLNSDNFMLSENAVAIAKKFGWWDGAPGTFDWSGAFSLGEYFNPFYSGRRMWRAYDLLAPSLKLDPTLAITDTSAGYPFAVTPDKFLTTGDVFRVYRDYYEGTEYSLVKDEVAAGPFNSPRRVFGGKAELQYPQAAWERPISIYRTDYVVVNKLHHDGLGVVWVAPHAAHASVFAPVCTSVATAVSQRYVVDAKQEVDRESLWWAVSGVADWAHGSMFNLAIADIRIAQDLWERQGHELETRLKTEAPEKHNAELLGFADKLHTGWWNLFWSLMGKYNNGYVVTRDADDVVTAASVGYPTWYLEATHYEKALNGAKATEFEDQAARLAKAAKQFAMIDGERKYPHGADTRASEPEIQV